MILLMVISPESSRLNRIAKHLLQKNLATNFNLEAPFERLILKNDSLIRTPVMQLTAKTRAVLFPEIEMLIKELYPENTPEICSVPIVHMDWSQAKQLPVVTNLNSE